ncbi:cardiomyopathy-associated protein 5 isoform X2 [Pogona vitticeps]
METDCNSVYDGSPDVSVEEEEEEEEVEAQGHRLTSSLKKLNQNEEVKSKLSDAIDTIQSEDSGLPWETSSSRCSTSLASETSATSGIYSMENSYTFPMDDGKTTQKIRNNSPDQAPLSPDENIDPVSKKYDVSSRPVQTKVSGAELDPADPQSWPFQVQPSKIKDYLVQITQEVETSVPEEKENALMRKGELPLKGTVRARIQQITAVLEERNKKIFRRINQKDVPPPSDVIRKPREQLKVFPRHGISVSLRHTERDPPDKHRKKEILSYNLRHVETNISKSGYNKDEKRVRQSFPTETVSNTSERLPTISSLQADKARKPESKLHSPGAQTSAPEKAIFALPNRHKKMEEEEKQPLLDGTAIVMPKKSFNLIAEIEEQNMQNYSLVTTEVIDIGEASKALPERETAQFHLPVSAESPSSPEQEGKPDATVTVISEPATQDVLYLNNTAAAQPESEQSVLPDARNQDSEFAVLSQLEIKDVALLHSAEETGKQNIPFDSPGTAGSLSEHEELLSPADAAKKEELELSYSKKEEGQEQLSMLLQAEREPVHSMKEPEAGETGIIPDLAVSRTKTQESQSNLNQTAEEHLRLPQPSYLMDEVQKKENKHLETDVTEQVTQAARPVLTTLEAGQADVSSSKGKAEKETALVESSEVPPSVSDTHREEIDQLFAAVSQSESQHPIISETTKAPEVSDPAELSVFKDEEVGSYSAAETPDSSEQLPSSSSHLVENKEKQDILPPSLVIATSLSEQLKSILPCAAETVEKQGHIPYSPETVPDMEEPMKEQGPLPYSPEPAPVVTEPMEKQGLLPFCPETAPVTAEPTEKQDLLPYSLETATVVSEQIEKQGPQPCSPETAPVMAEPTEKEGPLSYSPETASLVTEPTEKPGHVPYFPETVHVMVEQGPLSYSPETVPDMEEPMKEQGPLLYSPEPAPVVTEPMEKQGLLPFCPETAPVTAEPTEKQDLLPYSLETATVVSEQIEKQGPQPCSPETAPVMAEPTEKEGPLSYSPETASLVTEPTEKPGHVPYFPETVHVMVEQGPLSYSPETVPDMEEPMKEQGPLAYSPEPAPVVTEPMEKQGLLPFCPETAPVTAEPTEKQDLLPYSLETAPVVSEQTEKQGPQPCYPETAPVMAEPTEKEGPLSYSPETASLVTEPTEKPGHVPYSPETVHVMVEQGPLSYSPETVPVMEEPMKEQGPLLYSSEPAPVVTEPMEKQGLLPFCPETAPVTAEPTEKQDLLPYSLETAPVVSEQTEKQGPQPCYPETAPVMAEPTEKEGPLSYSPETASLVTEPTEKPGHVPYSPETVHVMVEQGPLSYSPETVPVMEEPMKEQGPLLYSSEPASVVTEPMEKQGLLPFCPETAPVTAEPTEKQDLLPYSLETATVVSGQIEKQGPQPCSPETAPVMTEPTEKEGPLSYSPETASLVTEPKEKPGHVPYSPETVHVMVEQGPLSYSPETVPVMAEPMKEQGPLLYSSEPASVLTEPMEKQGLLPFCPETAPVMAEPMETQDLLPYSLETAPVVSEQTEKQGPQPCYPETAPVMTEPTEKEGPLSYSPETASLVTEPTEKPGHVPYSPETVHVMVEQGPLSYSPETVPVMAEPMKEQGPLLYSSEPASVLTEPMEKQGLLPFCPETAPVTAEPTEKQDLLPYSLETAPVVSEQTEKQGPQPCSPETAPVMAEPTEKEGPLSYSPETASLVTEPTEKPGHVPYSPETVHVIVEQGPLTYSPETASVLAEPMKKQGPLPESLETAPDVSEATEKQVHLCYVPQTAPVLEETLVVIQNDEVIKGGIQPVLPTEVISEEVSLSREPDVATERKTVPVVSPLSPAKHPSDASVPSQEEVKSESQLCPPINGKLSPVDEEESHSIIYSGLQKHQFPSLATTLFGLDHSAESESSKQSMKRDSSVLSQLAEATTLPPLDEADKKVINLDKPELLNTDSLHPAYVLEEQEKAQMAVEETTEQLSHSSLSTEADILHPAEETKINGILPHLPATVEDLCRPVHLVETQEDQYFSKGTAVLDSEIEKCDSTETQSKDSTRQAIQVGMPEFEAEYQNVSVSAATSGKPMDESFPFASTEREDLQIHRSAIAELVSEQPASSEREREDIKLYSVISPASKAECPVDGLETQDRQDFSCDALNEASEPYPLISSLVPDQIRDQGVLTESQLMSPPNSEQSVFTSSDVRGKDEKQENQFPISPKMEEAQSFTSLLIGKARTELPYSIMASEAVQELSRSIPEDVVSRDANDMAPQSSLLSAVQLSDKIISPYAAAEGEKEEQTPLLLNEELKSTKEIRNQDSHLSLPSMVPPESQEQEPLYYEEEGRKQERTKLETEISKEQDVAQESSILQQELEHLNLLQPAKESQRQSIQPYPSAAAQDSCQPIDTRTEQQQDSLSETTVVETAAAESSESICEGKVEEIQAVWFDSAQLEHKPAVLSAEESGNASNPLIAAALDLEHLDSSYSIETPFFLPEAQNQPLEQKPSVSPLLMKKMEEQEVSSHPSDVSAATALSQSTSALVGAPEEEEKRKPHPHSPEVEDMVSLAAFLISEANTICTSSPLTTEKENLDTQTPFAEAGLLTKRSGSAFTAPSEISKTVEEKTESPTTPFESEQFAHKPEADATSRCFVQDRTDIISDMPALPPSFIQNEFSKAIVSESINDTHVHNLHSSVSYIASETMANKDVIHAEDLAKTEVEKCFPHAEETFKKEKKSRDHEDLKEFILAPEVSQAKEKVDISESYEVVSIDVSPFISSVGMEEDTSAREKLEYLEIASSLRAKPVDDAGDVTIDNEPSVCKPSGETLEGLKAEDHEYKEKESKVCIGKSGVQESIEINLDVPVDLENQGGDISQPTSTDYTEKFILIDDTSVTQTGEEKSVEEVQSSSEIKNEKLEEIPSSAAGSENIMDFSLLERSDAFQGVAKEKNVVVAHEDASEESDKDKIVDTVRENGKKTEDELNVADASIPLPSPKEDELPQSFLIPLPATTAKSDDLEVPPALVFLYNDFYKEAAGESKDERSTCPSDVETVYTDLPTHIGDHASDDQASILPEKDISEGHTPSSLKETQDELEDQPINEQALSQSVYERNKEGHEFDHVLTDTHAQTEVLEKIGEDLRDTVTDRPAEIVSDITVGICKPTHAIPFGSGLFRSGASSDNSSQQREESVTEETGHVSPEETSDEESSPILDYAASVYQNEASVPDEPRDAAFAVGPNQLSEVMEVNDIDSDVIRKPAEESTQHLEAYQDVSTQWQSEGQQENKLVSALEPMSQDVQALDHEHLPCWGAEGLMPEKRVEEVIGGDLMEHSTEIADQLAPDADYDISFGELDYSLLSHEFDTHPLYSIKEEEYSDIDEDLAELMDYEMVSQNDVFQAETSSEAACEELLFDDRKSLDHISDSYEFVNEQEASIYTEEEALELIEPDRLPRNVPESEIFQKETEQAQLDAYCYQCKCPISAEDKLFEEHKGHDVTDLDTAVKVLKSQLDGFQDVLQEKSIKIEEFVSEIEALFNSLEENCKEKEQLLEEQNESIVKMVIDHHERKAQSFEGIKNTKMEYLYEQMVNFQEYIDTAKETLETIIKEAEGMDDFVFLQSSEEINKRLLSAVENILTLEKMPDAFSQFEHYAGGSANGDQTLKHMPVPQTPKLQPQEPNSATSTSIAVYWTVDEDAIIDFFQVYCMEDYPGNKEQSGLVEEYRVTVKESNCILEDLEPGHSYSVWVMAVNYAGCSFPSDKSTFKTAPPTPVMKAEECTVCWDTATIRWSTSNPEATDSFTLEYCRQYSPEGEGLRSLAGIKRPEMKIHLESNVNYFVYVRAVNIFGTSEQSEAALISTKGTRFHIMKETAHPALHVSPNGTMICLPEDAKFTRISPVLGELLPARGWHYWETTVSGCEAYRVGICCSSVQQDCVLGQNNTSWCFHCSSKLSFVYKVLHNGEVSDVIVTEHPARIGILLDYNTGRLLFFNAERGQVLSTLRHKFTDAVHPAFMLEQPGVLNLHTGMELPEFVKQS